MKKPRKHGLSRLEKLLQDSIRHEIQIKAQWEQINNLIMRVQALEPKGLPPPVIAWPQCDHILTLTGQSAIHNGKCELCGQRNTSGSGEIWPFGRAYSIGGGSGLDRNKP
jgi:hypothetical protein